MPLNISKHPLVQSKLSLLRDCRTDSKLFREVLKEMTALLAYEATSDLTVMNIDNPNGEYHTQFGPFTPCRLREQIAVVPILRSGLGLIDEMLSLLPNAGILHLGIFRDPLTKQPIEYYNKLPSHKKDISVNTLNGDDNNEYQCAILLDAMIATGGTAGAAVSALKQWDPKMRIKVLSVVGSKSGVDRLLREHPDVQIYVAAIDNQLNDEGFIVPGLGDAGSRLFRTK